MTAIEEHEPPETGESGGLRTEIAQSWRRVRSSGLSPDLDLRALTESEFDPDSRLLQAAVPVLLALQQRLEGTGYSVLLADRDCLIVHRWFDDRRVGQLLDELGARPGAPFGEESVGTTALGTALEVRRPITVHGSEHFAEPFKRFSCYGQPIRHPVTRRVEGVLDITGMQAAASPLLAPLISRAVEDIQQRLVDQTRSSERNLLAAFQAAASKPNRVLAAIGENVVFSSRAALDLLQPSDYAMLRALVASRPRAGELRDRVALACGELVSLQASRVPGAGSGTLFRIDRQESSRAEPERARQSATRLPAGSGLPSLISGLPGTGRTTAARRAATPPVSFLAAELAVQAGEPSWARRLAELLDQPGTACIEGIELLPDRLLALLIARLKQPHQAQVVLTSGPRDELTGLARTLASMCIQRIDLPPLTDRAAEIADIAGQLLHDLDPDARVRLAPSALEALAAQQWPGNLHELRTVLTHALQHRGAGDITVTDLPQAYRSAAPKRQLRGMERAERDAIMQALADCAGNKVRAAGALGVSRTTLYARMRRLRITG